jgi:hypothetical protein
MRGDRDWPFRFGVRTHKPELHSLFSVLASLMRELSSFWMRAMVLSERRMVDMVKFGISSFGVDTTARVVQ